MITLKQATVHKYKSIESDQTFDIESDVTVLVGMNESGKTSLLEALAKSNYFETDTDFQFNTTHDYPRKEKKRMDKEGVVKHAITCAYHIDDTLISKINADVGDGTFGMSELTISHKYDNSNNYQGFAVNSAPLFKSIAMAAGDTDGGLEKEIAKITTKAQFDEFLTQEKLADKAEALKKFEKFFANEWEWSQPIQEYVARVWIKPNLPKFLYYDEYYNLPSRISIEKLQAKSLDAEAMKTAKALFELADINLEELIGADDFEDYKAELEATEATISEELFEYWSTNTNLEIVFDIDKIENTLEPNNTQIVEHILDIRVRNSRTRVSLPLKNRSKGFNWFFSFLVWFKKIQEDTNSQYIILLDEPGLNLHASAQSDLLDFIDHLSKDYQVIYTTHSPFMVRSSELHRVRTVLETNNGSVVSDSIQEKDPKTLFPLQAALGYDIAQNLYISEKNLLVEGTSDLIFLEAMSGILEADGRQPLREDITIVPVGGLEKVSAFISLLRGSKLDVVCLLDSAIDPSSQAKMDRLIADKIIKKQKILFYDAFVDSSNDSDIEDLFSKEDYLGYFNGAFTELSDVTTADLDDAIDRIVVQIAKAIGRPRYNHYRPANFFAQQGLSASDLSDETKDRFASAIEVVNSAF